MSSIFGSCGSGINKKVGSNGNRSRGITMVSPTVLKKVESAAEFASLSRTERNQKADELTSSAKIWDIHMSGAVLDPAKDEIEAGLGVVTTHSKDGKTTRGRVTVKVEMQPILNSGNYGLQGQVTSLLLRNYGSLHTSILVADAVLLEWNSSSLVIPSGKPIMVPPAATGAASAVDTTTMCTIIEQEFEAVLAKKAYVDKIINIVVKYNKIFVFDPILRNCQKFVADVLTELKCKIPESLEGKLVPYYNQLKELQGKKCKTLGTHEELDTYVQENIERPLTVQAMEYLLVQYFRFHVTSLVSCDNPKRWYCEHPGCLMHRLEQRINMRETLAYQMLQ